MACWKTTLLDVSTQQWDNLIVISFKGVGTMNLVIQTPRSEVAVLTRSENMKIQRLVEVICSGNAYLLLTGVVCLTSTYGQLKSDWCDWRS